MALPPRYKARARDRGGSYYRQRAAFREGAAGHRRRIRGDKAFRRLLKQMPEAMRDEVFAMLEATGDQLLAEMRRNSPSARVRAALSKRISRTSLRLRVGLIGRPINRKLFFARILEVGRKAQTVVGVKRTSKLGKAHSYDMDVRARAPDRFVRTTATKQIRDTFGGQISTFWERSLARAGAGVSDD